MPPLRSVKKPSFVKMGILMIDGFFCWQTNRNKSLSPQQEKTTSQDILTFVF